MQKAYYDTEATAREMGSLDHCQHNNNPDYWGYLLIDVATKPKEWEGKKALDVGCGTGRNIKNLLKVTNFERVDGVDISGHIIKEADRQLSLEYPKDKFDLYTSNGVDLDVLPSDEYDFICSTIVFQHIPVYSIRQALIQDIYRSLTKGGIFSCQFPFGKGYGKSAYTEDELDAKGTNTKHDFYMVEEDIKTLKKDLTDMGFHSFSYQIRPSFSDGHPSWLFFTAIK
jgi:ubiquinone/menaquinone biosynthesis C-methylase UbiE